MRYFLDTNVLIFYALGGENLDREVKSIFYDYENLIYISSEVVKETMHLIRYEKIDVKQWKKPNDVWNSIEEWNFTVDYVKKEHIHALGNLAMAKDHKDPADHIIIAQAIANKMALISSDQQFKHYKKQGLNLVFNNTKEKNKVAK
ncbi:MAG: type II toxin-antitoxin system VapC family toxin [Fibromonadales bacterium]|nr:type II toxin-antitoxin system VapC family toxin [Fibromonadales bacterium]